MNMASLWKLPVIYVCENNLYNEYTHNSETTAGDLAMRATAFGIPAHEIDGQDARLVYATATEAVARARRGDGPSFILANTYRYYGHHVGDVARTYYRTKEEEEYWRAERDPITILAAWLTAEGYADAAELEAIRAQALDEVQAGVAFALDAPFPNPAEVSDDVYA
jgi:pyruvate dehydrogenase E1 component alpha subunit